MVMFNWVYIASRIEFLSESRKLLSDHDFNNLTLPSPTTDYKHVRMNEEMNEWVWKRWKCEWMKERMNEQVTNKGN